MDERIKALQEKAKNLLSQGEEIRNRYKGAESMSAEDATTFDKLMDDYDNTVRDLNLARRDAKLQKSLDTPVSEITHPKTGEPITESRTSASTEEVLKAYGQFVRYGERGLTSGQQEILKAYQADNDIEGGMLIAPEVVVQGILKNMDDLVFMRELGTKYQVAKAESLGVVTMEADADDPIWTSELQTGDEENDFRLGKRQLFPHPLAKQVKFSRKLIRQATVDPVQLIMDRISRKFSVVEENAFLTGSGDQQPLGIFTASEFGINTDRDVVTGANTAFTADGLINAQYALKSIYRTNARWIFHRFAIREIRKLKYGDGTYIWSPGLERRDEPTILGIPYVESEFAPSTFTQNLYIGILGDFSFYWIADALDLQIQILNELYAKSNQIGYIARKETDAMPVLNEAFVRLKLSA